MTKNNYIKAILLSGVAVFTTGLLLNAAQADRNWDHRYRETMRGGNVMMRMLNKFDTNKDNKISNQEVEDSLKASFAKADNNKDGKLSNEEFVTIPRFKRFKEAAKKGPKLRMIKPEDVLAATFKRHDADGNGTVDFNEYSSDITQFFTEMDKNKDGFVTADELPAKKMRRGKSHKMMKKTNKTKTEKK